MAGFSRCEGVADRVDTTADGRVIVSDYKSGKQDKFKKLDDDPFVAGTGSAARACTPKAPCDTPAGSAHAGVLARGGGSDGKERLGYAWTDGLRARFVEVLAVIVDGIDGGVFAAAPGEWNTFRQTNEDCTFCEFDPVCVRDRGEQAEAKASAPEVQVRVRLKRRRRTGERHERRNVSRRTKPPGT